MSSDDEPPTSAAEMEILSVVEDVLDDAGAVEILAMTYAARCTMHAAKARYLRGDMAEAERREWVRVVDEIGPMIEAMIERNRERNND